MLILAVDDESLQLSRLKNAIAQACPDAEIAAFQDPRAANEWIKTHRPGIAFLDIEMPEITGTMLAEKIIELYPNTNIIFVTAYIDYAVTAFRMHASGYVQKPVSVDRIRAELSNLRYPEAIDQDRRLRVVCWGDFSVLWDNIPLKFKRIKTLELFAYLIDRRGSNATVNEICYALWEDSDDDYRNKSYLRHLISDLSATLAEIGQEDVFIKQKNSYAINTRLVSCDYYDYLNGDEAALHSFNGQYMTRYSWAENTLAYLLSRINRIN